MKIKTCPAVRYNYDIVREEEQKANIKQWSAGFRLEYLDVSKDKLLTLEKAVVEEVMNTFMEISQEIIEKEMAKDLQEKRKTVFKVRDNGNKHELQIEISENLWIVSYIRPKKVKGFLGLSSGKKEAYTTSLKSSKSEQVQELLNKFLDGNTDYLNHKII